MIETVDSSFFGYKTHMAMNEERIITAAVITTGEKSDEKYPEHVKGGKKVHMIAHVPSKEFMKRMRECIKGYTEPRNKMYLQ